MDPTSGHMGIKRTLSRITDRFMWSGVAKDVENLVSSVHLQDLVNYNIMNCRNHVCLLTYYLNVGEYL